MIVVKNVDVWGFEHAIRGMRNPMNSWDMSDSPGFGGDARTCEECKHQACHCVYRGVDSEFYCVGENDLALMQKLYRAGPEHRKYLRQIFVSMDIVAPLYWWKEFDQYKVGVTTDSCSTMHKIVDKEFELDDFSYERIEEMSDHDPLFVRVFSLVIDTLNEARRCYLDTNDKRYWWQIIQLLPSSYNQRRTVTMSYENVFNIIHQRTGHKLDEWRDFCNTLLMLPYVSLLAEKEKEKEKRQ